MYVRTYTHARYTLAYTTFALGNTKSGQHPMPTFGNCSTAGKLGDGGAGKNLAFLAVARTNGQQPTYVVHVLVTGQGIYFLLRNYSRQPTTTHGRDSTFTGGGRRRRQNPTASRSEEQEHLFAFLWDDFC